MRSSGGALEARWRILPFEAAYKAARAAGLYRFDERR